MKENTKKLIIATVTVAILAACYITAKRVPQNYVQELGSRLSLPVFTFFVAIVDGFNPCNMFVVTLLLSLILSTSESRKRIYAVGYTFIVVVYIFYFLFMALWLNIMLYIGFVKPLRIAIASIAIIAGIINCKEMFFYRRGVTLMLSERFVAPLKRRIGYVARMVKTGSMPALIAASATLAVFSSLVELPCTSGFPMIYTSILTGRFIENSFTYYVYLLFYNLVYVIPLGVIIAVTGYTFKGKKISKETMEIIKFVGGAIMLLLGIVLLVNPGLVGV